MINEKLMKTFLFTFTTTAKLCIVPFAYDVRTNNWSVRINISEIVVSHLVTVILCFRLVYVTSALVTSGLNAERLHEKCLLGLQVTMFINGAGFQIAYWRRRREIVWLLNQTRNMNKGKLKQN